VLLAEDGGRPPKHVVGITVRYVYFICANSWLSIRRNTLLHEMNDVKITETLFTVRYEMILQVQFHAKAGNFCPLRHLDHTRPLVTHVGVEL
jgi:hypothetical protein